MKHSAVLMIVAALITSSCSFFVEPEVTFRVENKTAKDLDLLFYHQSALLDSVFISKGGKYESSHRYRPGNAGDLTPFKTETDSLVVRFEDGKVLEYYCNGIILFKNYDRCHFEKNLMDFDTGTSRKKKLSDKTTKVISFEASDYDKAL